MDATAEMPAGWLLDEPEMVPDPESEKPEDWSVVWEAGPV